MYGMLLLSFLAISSLLVHSSYGSLDRIKVPGVGVGQSFGFNYYGENLKRVTISIEDSIGKSLHIELRHNEECTDNYSPQLRFTTKTYRRWDYPIVKQRTELTITKWIVEAKANHWLIKKMKCEEFCFDDNGEHESFIFNYRYPHTLSRINLIRIYGTTCNGGTFQGYLSSVQQPIPASFSQINIRGRCVKEWPQMRFYFNDPEAQYVGYTLNTNYISVWSPKWSSNDLTNPATMETFDEVILQT